MNSKGFTKILSFSMQPRVATKSRNKSSTPSALHSRSIAVCKSAMPSTCWFFRIKEGNIYTYETKNNDASSAKLLCKKGAGSGELGHVVKVSSTAGKDKVLQNKYGLEYGIAVSPAHSRYVYMYPFAARTMTHNAAQCMQFSFFCMVKVGLFRHSSV